jgi:hypothetical protein
MEHAMDVAPMARWSGIDNTKEVHPMEVASYIQRGWSILMGYQRRVDVPHQEIGLNGYVAQTTRSEYEAVVLMGQTNLDGLREQIANATATIKDLRVKEMELLNLQVKHGIMKKDLQLAQDDLAHKERYLAEKREQAATWSATKTKLETDISKIRTAIGELKMKEILGS